MGLFIVFIVGAPSTPCPPPQRSAPPSRASFGEHGASLAKRKDAYGGGRSQGGFWALQSVHCVDRPRGLVVVSSITETPYGNPSVEGDDGVGKPQVVRKLEGRGLEQTTENVLPQRPPALL